jgi:hypothetical protein
MSFVGYSNRIQSWLLVVLQKAERQDHRGAIQDYESYRNWFCYFTRAVSRELQDHRGAILDFPIVIEINPNLVEAYYNRGPSKVRFEMKKVLIPDFR